jgi:hypothetical protein
VDYVPNFRPDLFLFANIPDGVEKNAEYYHRCILTGNLLDTAAAVATPEKEEYIPDMAYQSVHAVREELKQKGIRYDWRHIRNIMSSQTLVTARMKLENKDVLIIRQPSRANQQATKLYTTLNFKHSCQGMRKKSVVPHM